MNIEQELHKHLFQQREEQTQHLEYNLEFQFYFAVASGDMETVSRYCTAEQDETVYDGIEYGRLSENRLQNARYHFVVAVALITRVCVEQGMERETAYTLSDILIQRMDRLTTVSEISALHNAMIRDFTRRMQEVRRAHAYSIHVSKAISYISAHLHEKLTTQDIADAISLNRSYLSTLFRREIGKTLHQYLLSAKLQSAAQLLTTSEISLSEIGAYYGFASQSHFIQCFQRETGLTPMEYRRKFYQRSEVSDSKNG